ncbi:hypothetical protein M378DRAFT_160097 [Amanita muscaria Koide BX008]|uniref:Uncharacterized protein n=1 Tax=Amanita muscaria (strain Koide BX008) TaxID=946122 RepID=A0A0C2TJE7_AMAMK|nr:hypothetical protein M378DRAFT_160097 [Amanita muscaria Koide BX008]
MYSRLVDTGNRIHTHAQAKLDKFRWFRDIQVNMIGRFLRRSNFKSLNAISYLFRGRSTLTYITDSAPKGCL